MIGLAARAIAQPLPSSPAAEEERWSSFLPIWREEAEKRGHELPLPFGVSVIGMGLDEPHHVTDLRLSQGATAPTSVPRSFVQVSPVEVNAWSTTARADVWLFPFLNLYGVAGYSGGIADLNLTVLPGFQNLSQTIRIPSITYEGPTYGGGGVIALGYKNLFGMFDANYTVTDLDLLNSDVHTVVLDWRLGWRQKIGWVHGSLWVGAMYQKSSQTMSGTVAMSPGNPPLNFEVDQTTDEPWNLLIGTQWELGRHWWVLIEGGVGERHQIVGSISYRF